MGLGHAAQCPDGGQWQHPGVPAGIVNTSINDIATGMAPGCIPRRQGDQSPPFPSGQTTQWRASFLRSPPRGAPCLTCPRAADWLAATPTGDGIGRSGRRALPPAEGVGSERRVRAQAGRRAGGQDPLRARSVPLRRPQPPPRPAELCRCPPWRGRRWSRRWSSWSTTPRWWPTPGISTVRGWGGQGAFVANAVAGVVL